jgi:hypothetical protein
MEWIWVRRLDGGLTINGQSAPTHTGLDFQAGQGTLLAAAGGLL